MSARPTKLPRSALEKLRAIPVDRLQPHALLTSPAYAFLPKNEKLILVKASLDFFDKNELSRFSSFYRLYFLPAVETAEFFENQARRVRAVLTAKAILTDFPESVLGAVSLDIPSYERSDSILRILGTLWNTRGEIEPHFVVAFSQALCGSLGEERLARARDRSAESFEKAILLSSWAVFLALHLGYCELSYVERIYRETFEAVAFGGVINPDRIQEGLIDLILSSEVCLRERIFKLSFFEKQPGLLGQKISARFRRIQNEGLWRIETLPSLEDWEGLLAV